MPRKLEFIAAKGKQYGRWTVLDDSRSYWRVRCECGLIKEVRRTFIMDGSSAGCVACHSRKHGMEGTPTYNSWTQMKRRCLNQNTDSYKYYGARGISICNRWLKFENFLADMGCRPEGKTLDRIDVNGNYEPRNCRWAELKVQMRNRRDAHKVEFEGKQWQLADLADHLGITANALRHRLRRGYPEKRLASGPLRTHS